MLGQKEYTVKKSTVGAYVKGVWVDTGKTQVTVKGCLQPIDSDTLDVLDEGSRSVARFVLYVYKNQQDLRVAKAKGDFTCDIVVVDNTEYRVIGKQVWKQHRIQHTMYILGEIGQ